MFCFCVEWEKESQFHAFLTSDNYAKFMAHVKPVAAAPAIPQLFLADARSELCTSAARTQMFKLKVADMSNKNAVEDAWHELVHQDGSVRDPSFQAWGLNNVEGEFLGMIGWDSVEVRSLMFHILTVLTVMTGLQ
jgi:hypothetical protein